MSQATDNHEPVTVIKQDPQGREMFRYPGKILEKTPNHILLEALFTFANSDFHGIPLKVGDPFVEVYYTDRWYNVYAMYDREDGRLKGYYCNISLPAEVRDGTITFRDLALDLLVYPDGRQLVLDEDEFAGLDLDPETKTKALKTLDELKASFREEDPEVRAEEIGRFPAARPVSER